MNWNCPILTFPGQSNKLAVNRTLEQFESAEFVPFRDACEKGIPFIMCGHILVPAITADNRPASMSKTMLTDILRKRFGFQGIIICDALVMDAIRNDFSSCRAGVEAVKAGCDMVMKPGNFIAIAATGSYIII